MAKFKVGDHAKYEGIVTKVYQSSLGPIVVEITSEKDWARVYESELTKLPKRRKKNGK